MAREELCEGSAEAKPKPSTSRRKSSERPVPGKSHTSSSRKSRVSSWIRQGWEVCAVFGSRIVDLIPPHQPNPTSATPRDVLDGSDSNRRPPS
jgi:hypothetical protein